MISPLLVVYMLSNANFRVIDLYRLWNLLEQSDWRAKQ